MPAGILKLPPTRKKIGPDKGSPRGAEKVKSAVTVHSRNHALRQSPPLDPDRICLGFSPEVARARRVLNRVSVSTELAEVIAQHAFGRVESWRARA